MIQAFRGAIQGAGGPWLCIIKEVRLKPDATVLVDDGFEPDVRW
jgi:hypothetical protein